MGNWLCKEDENDEDYIDKNEMITKKDIVEYLKPLPFYHFNGEASTMTQADSNESNTTNHLAIYLHKLDKIMRQSDSLELNLEDLLNELKNCSKFRHCKEENEASCFKKLKYDAIRFTKIYKERSVKNPEMKHSESLQHDEYWGTRQQLLFGKVVCDWLSEEDMPPMDPIFGVLLNPTGGRVGPGDSCWIHKLMFDDFGDMAHHAAVHDAFGYLLNYHDIGPGYDYIGDSILPDENAMSGQYHGYYFWKNYINEIGDKVKDISAFKMV